VLWDGASAAGDLRTERHTAIHHATVRKTLATGSDMGQPTGSLLFHYFIRARCSWETRKAILSCTGSRKNHRISSASHHGLQHARRPATCKRQKANAGKQKACNAAGFLLSFWLREKDLNLRPLGYEPNELPDCSIAR
jgi:hypothetical protein